MYHSSGCECLPVIADQTGSIAVCVVTLVEAFGAAR